MKYKRLTALLAAISFLLCGCEMKDKTDPAFDAAPSTPETTQQEGQDSGSVTPAANDTLTNIARAEKLDLFGEEWMGFSVLSRLSDGYSAIDFKDDTFVIHDLDNSLNERAETVLAPIAPYDGYYFANGLVSVQDDVIYALIVMENHSDMAPFKDGDEDYDWDAYNAAWESDYYLCTYNPDGTLSGKVLIEGLENYQQSQGYDDFDGLYSEGDKVYLTIHSGAILRIAPDGTLTETYTPDAPDLLYVETATILSDRDGKPVFYLRYSTQNATSVAGFYEFDTETGKPGTALYTGPDAYDMNGVFPGGFDEYRLCFNSPDGLLGLKDDGTTEVVIDWDASDLPAMSAQPLADGSFLCLGYSDGLDGTYRVTRKYASELQEKQIITIGMLGWNSCQEFIHEFNRSQDTYQLQSVIYQNSDGSELYSGGTDDAFDNLKKAVISDEAPDLLIVDERHELFLTYGSRGVFTDLNELMEEDAEINSSTLVPNYLAAMQHPDGSLYSLSPSFYVQTIAVKEKFTDKENWTVDDMIDLYEGADDIFYYWSTKEDALRMFLTGTDFTDEITGTCRFDSPEFVKILEFCDRYPTESTCPEKDYEDEEQMRKFDQWHLESYHKYQNDQDYLFPVTLCSVSSGSMASAYAYAKADLGGGITLTGYPSEDQQGGKITTTDEIGILSTCEDKTAAWSVLKAYQDYNKNQGGYPISEEAFETALDDEMYIWDFGERSDAEYYEDDSTVYPLTQEERDDLEEYIRGCETYMMLDDNVETIVMEEAEMYFSGDRSAEDTAQMIQSRAEIMLSEQSG